MQRDDSQKITDELKAPDTNSCSAQGQNSLATAMSAALSEGDAEAAAKLVLIAETQYPGENSLASKLARCKSIIKRAEWLELALKAMQRDLDGDHYSAALGHYRQALNLSRGLPALKAKADEAGKESAERLLPQNWRIASVLLQEAADTKPAFTPDKALSSRLEEAYKAEAITSAIHHADRLGLHGNTDQARRELTDLLIAYPEDRRIRESLVRLKVPSKPATNVKPPVSEETDPEDNADDPARDDVEAAEETAHSGWRRRIAVRSEVWNAFKNFASIAATAAMLATAALLIWHHFTPRTNVAKPVNPPTVAAKYLWPSEERAWEFVRRSRDPDALRSYLTSYPGGSHAFRARVKLAVVIWEKVDKTDIEELDDYLRAFPESPYRREAERLKKAVQLRSAAGKLVTTSQ